MVTVFVFDKTCSMVKVSLLGTTTVTAPYTHPDFDVSYAFFPGGNTSVTDSSNGWLSVVLGAHSYVYLDFG